MTPVGRLAFHVILARRRRLGVLPILVAAAAGACRPDPAPDAGTTVHDSAGVRIVENTAQPAERWSVREVVRIGELDGPESVTFHRIADVEVAGDRVYVLDAGDHTVKAYDRAGAYVLGFGREGEGPADFRGPSQLIARGDTLTVFDARLGKLAHFDREGELLSTRRPRFQTSGVFSPVGLEPVPGGFVAWTASSSCRFPPPEDLRVPWTLFEAALDGEPVDTLVATRGRSGVPIYPADLTGCTVVPRLAGLTPLVAVSPHGRVAYGDGDRYEVLVLRAGSRRAGSDGAAPGRAAAEAHARPLEAIVRRSVEVRAVTAEERARHRAAIFDPDRPYPLQGALRRAAEAALDTTPEFDTWPAYAALRWDSEGRLWVRRTASPSLEPVLWEVFDADGGLIADIELPVLLDVKVIESDTVWGVERGAFGVERLVGYALVRDGGR